MTRGINPYVEKFFGDWFKNVIVLLLLIIGGIVVAYGLPGGWIDQDFAIELLFLVIGLFLGRWLANGTK
jgi:hypothetical protein